MRISGIQFCRAVLCACVKCCVWKAHMRTLYRTDKRATPRDLPWFLPSFPSPPVFSHSVAFQASVVDIRPPSRSITADVRPYRYSPRLEPKHSRRRLRLSFRGHVWRHLLDHTTPHFDEARQRPSVLQPGRASGNILRFSLYFTVSPRLARSRPTAVHFNHHVCECQIRQWKGGNDTDPKTKRQIPVSSSIIDIFIYKSQHQKDEQVQTIPLQKGYRISLAALAMGMFGCPFPASFSHLP